MSLRDITRLFVSLVLAVMVTACSKPDPSLILGSWRAESFAFESLKLPLTANFEVTRNNLILKTEDGAPVQEFPLSKIRAEGDTIELELKGGLGISLKFTVEDTNSIYFKIPIIGTKVIFKRRAT